MAPPDKPVAHQPRPQSPALSQANQPKDGIAGRAVAILVADGVAATSATALTEALVAAGATVELLGAVDGAVRTTKGERLPVDRAVNTTSSVLYDAVVVCDGGEAVEALTYDGLARHFVAEAYKHGKPLGVLGVGRRLAQAAGLPLEANPTAAGALDGVAILAPDTALSTAFVDAFIETIAAHRHPGRPVAGVAA